MADKTTAAAEAIAISLLVEVASQSTTTKAAGTVSKTTTKGKSTGATAKRAGSNTKGPNNTKKGNSNAFIWTGNTNEGASNTTEGTGTNKKATRFTAKGSNTTNKGASSTSKEASTSYKDANAVDKGANTIDKGASTSNIGTNNNYKAASSSKKGTKNADIVTCASDKESKHATSLKMMQSGPHFVRTRKTVCPFNSGDWQNAGHIPGAAARAKRDIACLYSQPVPGVFFVPDEDNLMCVRAMIVGNFDTPYEGGFFHFYTRFGPQYPFEPPRVCAMSCYRFGNKVRFNPNMYEDGTVCLSILGTWSGPAWTAANNLTGVLLSIQSLFCDQALCNEPGYATLRDTGSQKVELYDVYVRHETLRVAVIHTIEYAEDYKIPSELIKVMKCSFMEYYSSYIASCETYRKYDKKKLIISLISSREFIPNFTKVEADLIKLHATLTKEQAAGGEFGLENKLINDNTALACPSSESSLSEFSDTDMQTTATKPSDSKTTSPQSPTASSASGQKDFTNQHEDPSVSASSSSKDLVGEVSQFGPQPKHKFQPLTSSGLANLVKSIASNIRTLGSGNAGAEAHKTKNVNAKTVNAIKVDSALCEKILKEVAAQQRQADTSSYDSNIEQCLDFMSFMAESESEYEELSDSDQFSSSDEVEDDDDKDIALSKDEKLPSPADRDAGIAISADSSSKEAPIFSSLDLGTKSNEAAMEVDGTVGSQCAASKVSNDMEVCDDDGFSSDSSGRGCKRESSGIIKSRRGENESGSSSPK